MVTTFVTIFLKSVDRSSFLVLWLLGINEWPLDGRINEWPLDGLLNTGSTFIMVKMRSDNMHFPFMSLIFNPIYSSTTHKKRNLSSVLEQPLLKLKCVVKLGQNYNRTLTHCCITIMTRLTKWSFSYMVRIKLKIE